MRLVLFSLLLLVSLSSISSGILMMKFPTGDVFQLSITLLHYSPFQSFFWPGFILAVLVGGSSLVAFYLLLNEKRKDAAYNWSIATGMILVCWIVGQLFLIRQFYWLQVVYLVAGKLIIFVAFELKRLRYA